MRVYLSHSITGPKGSAATKEDMKENCDKAKLVAKTLRAIYPEVEFYVPAESENFVGKAYTKGYLTIAQILEIDCDIIRECDAVIFYNIEGSNGCKIELECTQNECIPYAIIAPESSFISTLRALNILFKELKSEGTNQQPHLLKPDK
jgi:hypothetical protein